MGSGSWTEQSLAEQSSGLEWFWHGVLRHVKVFRSNSSYASSLVGLGEV